MTQNKKSAGLAGLDGFERRNRCGCEFSPPPKKTQSEFSELLKVLKELLSAPNPGDSAEMWERFNHFDIDMMTPFQLQRELFKTRLSVCLTENPNPWFLERLRQISEQLKVAGHEKK